MKLSSLRCNFLAKLLQHGHPAWLEAVDRVPDLNAHEFHVQYYQPLVSLSGVPGGLPEYDGLTAALSGSLTSLVYVPFRTTVTAVQT
jgi:hypothetical protein